MTRAPLRSDCKHCGHSVEAHEAAECWWDMLMNVIASFQRLERCDCPGYEPLGLRLVKI